MRPVAPAILSLAFALLLAAGSPPALAQQPAVEEDLEEQVLRAQDRVEPGVEGALVEEDLEEQVLRAQVELYLNEFARWDAERARVVIARKRGEGGGAPVAPGDLGPLEPIGEMLLARATRPDESGRLRLREGFKLRPFARVAQDFIAEGGMEDIEAMQRFRSGKGENPFRQGIPPRVQKAVAGMLKALNEQEPGRGVRDAYGLGGGDEGDEDENGRAPSARPERRRRPSPSAGSGQAPRREAPESKDGREARRELIRRWIAERFEVEPEELDELERYARDLVADAERDLERAARELRERLAELRRSEGFIEMRERAARLGRRAADELRRALQDEDVKAKLDEAQRRVLEFLASEEGQELQRRVFEFMNSDDGREIRRRIEEFLDSERGRELLRRAEEWFRGRPDRARERGAEDRRRELYRESDREVERQRRDREGREREPRGGQKLY